MGFDIRDILYLPFSNRFGRFSSWHRLEAAKSWGSIDIYL